MSRSPLLESPVWHSLQKHAVTMRDRRLAPLFADDPERPERLSVSAAGLYLDYSKQKLVPETLALLLRLAERQHVGEGIARMFAGECLNPTEGRAALHVALRAPRGLPMQALGCEVGAEVHEVLDRMYAFAGRLRSGAWLGAKGDAITDIVNIGIGGSDLGPRMVCQALRHEADGPRAHYVANVDGAQLHEVLSALEPARTLFVVTSKTFTTQETMANARHARDWLVQALGEAAVSRHFVAVSTNAAAVSAFGIEAGNMFGFWDWVGGRYSVWSAVGLSLVVALGPERFAQFLAGAHAMDLHFRDAPLEANMPVLMGLLGVWNYNLLGATSQVVAPYAQCLERFVAWLQQLEMESNGKRVHLDGTRVDLATTPPIWGDVGTNSQHAFFQMLHQSPQAHPVDFILPIEAPHPYQDQHRMLIANCLAQSAALMRGKTAEEVRAELSARMDAEDLEAAVPHRVFPGDRPSSTLLMPRVDAYHLGALMALYEHRTYVMSLIWEINAFDQWGVELGKKLTGELLRAMEGADVDLDPSTRSLLGRATG